jgi:hypothetical protein
MAGEERKFLFRWTPLALAIASLAHHDTQPVSETSILKKTTVMYVQQQAALKRR